MALIVLICLERLPKLRGNARTILLFGVLGSVCYCISMAGHYYEVASGPLTMVFQLANAQFFNAASISLISTFVHPIALMGTDMSVMNRRLKIGFVFFLILGVLSMIPIGYTYSIQDWEAYNMWWSIYISEVVFLIFGTVILVQTSCCRENVVLHDLDDRYPHGIQQY